VLGLQDVGGLDALVGRGNLDQDTRLVDTLLFVELFSCQTVCWMLV